MILCNLASCLISLQNYSSAIQILQQVFVIKPKHPRALERRATALHLMGRIEEAESDCNEALTLPIEKKLRNKLQEMLAKIKNDKAKKTEMYKKMIKPKKTVSIPEWLLKVTRLIIIPFSLVSKITSLCKRKKA